MDNQLYMKRCLELAYQNLGAVSPNPMVGAVIVGEDGEILGEGAHQKFGEAHAEVNAFSAISNGADLSSATLFVNLEPCSFTGKTPPCTDAILKSGIKRIVIGMTDPNPKVAGKGIEILRSRNLEVIAQVLESECQFLNRRFIVNQTEQRPYIILKWAETADGFIARNDYSSKWISSESSRALVHEWRAKEDAILVGTNTALRDNPHLTARVEGPELPPKKQPLRVFLDRELKVPSTSNLFNDAASTLCFTEKDRGEEVTVEHCSISFGDQMWQELFSTLYERNVGSIIVEGGSKVLHSLIEKNLWDEARVFRSTQKFKEGIPAPNNLHNGYSIETSDSDKLHLFSREKKEIFTKYL